MKGEDLLISKILEKQQQQKVMRENLNQLNNILVSCEASVYFLTLA